MYSKKGLFLIMGVQPSFSDVQASRFLYLAQEMQNKFESIYVMMEGNKETCNLIKDIVTVKPKISLTGSFPLLRGILYRVQFTFYAIYFIFNKKIDFIVIRGYEPIILYIILKIFGKRLYTDFHGLYHLELFRKKRMLRGKVVKLIESIILKITNKILVISDGIKSQIPTYEEKCIYLPNGVNLEKIEKSKPYIGPLIPENKKVIGFIGNWEQVMKIDDICDAINYLENSIAIIVGRGFQYEHIVEKYKHNSNIIFTDKIDQEIAYSILKRMDVCIVPYDGHFYMSKIKDFFSNRKISEYLGAGKPMAIAGIEGIPGYLKENIHYIKYEPNNPKDLAMQVNRIINDKLAYEKMSHNNKQLAKKFKWEYLVEDSGFIEDIVQNA